MGATRSVQLVPRLSAHPPLERWSSCDDSGLQKNVTGVSVYFVAVQGALRIICMSSSIFSMPAQLASFPHPDSYAQNLSQELRAAVEAFKKDHRGRQPLAAVAKAFKRATLVIEQSAYLSGKHQFLVGDRVVLCDLKQRQDLNGCVAIVKSEVDDDDGRIEVCVGTGSKKEMIRAKPPNLRLDWHVASDLHVSVPNTKVLVRDHDGAFCDEVCQVVSSEPVHYNFPLFRVTVRALASATDVTEAAPVDHLESVSAFGLVPASYIDIANDVCEHAVTIALLAAGVCATPAVKEMMTAVHICAEFHMRCVRSRDAARVCTSVLEALHSGGKSGSTPSSRMKDYCERLAWISWFCSICTDGINVTLQARGFLDDACSILTLCKDVICSVQGNDTYNYFVLLNNLALLHMKKERYDEAEAMYKEAMRIRELVLHSLVVPSPLKAMTECDEDFEDAIVDTMHGLAMVHIEQNRLEDAEALYHEALRMQRLKFGHDSLEVANLLHSLGVVHEKRDRLDEAEAVFREAMRTREVRLGHDSLPVSHSLGEIALLHVRRKQYNEGEDMLKEVLRIQQQRLGRDSTDIMIADTLGYLAEMYDKYLNRLEEADQLYTQALRIRRYRLGEDSMSVADLMGDVGHLYYKMNRLPESENMFRQAIRIKESKLGRNVVEVAQDLGRLGLVLCALDRNAEGEDLLREAMRIRESFMGDGRMFEHLSNWHDSKEEAESLVQLANMAALQHKTEEAESWYQDALRIYERLGSDAALIAHLRDRIAELQPPPLSDI